MSRLFKKYIAILNRDKMPLTETEIIHLKSRISTNPCSLTESEIDQLTECVLYKRCEYNITPEQAQKGLDYLKSKCFKLSGQPRNTKQTRNMPSEFFQAIEDYDHFTFVGFTTVQYNIYTSRSFYMPVWRIYTKTGQYFDYYMDLGLEFSYLDYTIESNKPELKLVASEI